MALHALTLLLCTFSLSLSFAVASSHMASSSSSSSCSVVTPSTPLVSFLEQLQETALQTFGDSNFDPKTYVDLPLKFTLSETHQAFQNLPRLSSNGTISAEVLKGFINRYFKGAGDDLVCWQPHDFVAEPEGFLTKVKHPEVRVWALKVHSLWRNLSRKVSREVEKNPQLHTLLPLPNPVVIPGSRFREVYYWDSYWVIRGLLVSKMHQTATAIVMNLVSLIEKYGFVLNGARQYYTNRSQPPLLSSMIYEIYRSTGDIELVKRCLPALLKEHAFWNSDIHRVTIVDAQGHSHNLNRYQAMWNKPRPESSTMDKKSASKFLNISEKQDFYRDIASAAESGWDFSTRWMRVPPDYSTLATTSVIPVDLNAYLLGMEINIAFFAKAIGDETTVKHFMELSDARKKAINSVFWSASKKQWLDYWLNSGTCEVAHVWEAKHQNKNVFASNFVPLWMEPFYSDGSLVDIVVHALKTSGLIRAAGIATSLTDSGQQWDFPNGWAPLQHMLAEGLVKSGSKEARSLAEEIAIKWIRSNYVSYKKTGVMHEKLDVEKCGEYGGGGEYAPQTGFGWSNGVVLAFLEEFGWPQDRSIDC